MKINIRKFGTGASLEYEPLPTMPTQGRNPEAPEEPIDDSLIKSMVGKALTSDAKAYASKYGALLNQYESLPIHIKNSTQGRMMRSQLKDNWSELNELVNSKTQLDKIATEKKDAMSEYAIFQGHVVAQDVETGDVVNLTLPEYSQNMNSEAPKYKALTNGQLMNLRESDIRFAGKNNVLPFLNNAVSTDSVVKNIKAALQNLGSYSKGSSDVSYEQKSIEDGANAALNQGLTYVKTASGDSKASNAENIKAAGNAMWGMLDDASKDLLRIKAIHYGYAPQQVEGAAMGLALAMLKPAVQEKITEKDSEALAKLPGSKSGSGSGSGKRADIDYWSGIGTGKPGASETINLVNGDNNKIIMEGKTFAPFMKDKTNFYGTTSLDKITSIGAIAEMESVYFGDKKVPTETLDSIIYANTKPGVVWMPFKEEADGSIHPNLDRSQDLEDVRKKIATDKVTDPNIKMEMYRQVGFNYFDNKGEPSETVELKPFLTFQGYSNTNAIKEESKWFEIKEEKNDWYKKQFEEGPKKVVSSQYFDGWFTHPDVLQGMVYIPLRAGAGVSGQYASGTTPEVDPSYKAIESYEGTGLGQLGGGTTFRQLAPNTNLDKNVLQQ